MQGRPMRKLRTVVLALSMLSLIAADQLGAAVEARAGNSGAAFVGGVIGGALSSAIANSGKVRKAKPSKKSTSRSKSTRPAVVKKAPPAVSAKSVAGWMSAPLPDGTVAVTSTQGLIFTYDKSGNPRLIFKPNDMVIPAGFSQAVPVSIVVDGAAFGVLEAKAQNNSLVIEDPQVLGLEERMKSAREISVTSGLGTATVSLAGFTVAIEQLSQARQQQALVAINTPVTPVPADEPPAVTPQPTDPNSIAVLPPANDVTIEPANITPSVNNISPAPTYKKKVALVIGNGAYKNAGQLANPRNDATAVSQMLSKLGFKVIVTTDASKSDMESSIRTFIQDARSSDLSLFFYSGHGMEVAGENFLLPVDAELADESALSFEVINSKVITNAMGGENKVGIILLDACRDNPFTKSLRRSMVASRAASVSNGLAPINTEGGGLVVAFATAPGDVAADGDGANSPFTTALLKWAPQPGLEIDQVMKRVKAEVATLTNNDQRPWTNSDLTSDVYIANK